MWPFTKRKSGSTPDGFTWVGFPEAPFAYNYQMRESWPYPNVPAHETRAALTNCWNGNQLPGPVNFIPGIQKSKFTWNVPTSYANTLRNQQYNAGYNIGGMSSVQSAALLAQVQAAWQNRTGMNN